MEQWLWGINGDKMFCYLPFINELEKNYPKIDSYEIFVAIARRWQRGNVQKFKIALPRYTAGGGLK